MISIETGAGGRVYQIWKQQQAATCGVACAWMARGIAKRMSFAEDEWELAHRIYNGAVAGALTLQRSSPPAPMTIDPRGQTNDQNSFGNTFSRFGLFANQLAGALSSQGLRVEHYNNGGNPIKVIHTKIAIDKPGIALLKWANGGGHFVVIGRAVASNVSFLDPWDGHVNEQPNNGTYAANYGGIGNLIEILYLSA